MLEYDKINDIKDCIVNSNARSVQRVCYPSDNYVVGVCSKRKKRNDSSKFQEQKSVLITVSKTTYS